MSLAEGTALAPDDRLARRNAVLLSVLQACYGVTASSIILTGGLVGKQLAPVPALATLPVSMLILGSAMATFFMSMLMARSGRKVGFWVGALLGLVGSLMAAYAIYIQSFWLFCLGIHLNGYYQACAQYYRFAAADTASVEFKPRAISWVLVGGVAAAVLGPQMVLISKDWMSPVTFAGSFLAMAGVTIFAMCVIGLLRFPDWQAKLAADAGAKRPLSEILQQPRLIGAIVAGMVAYGLMSLVMTATPLAMLGCNHTVTDAGFAIQWHILAMFAPSFFTGSLIARFGKQAIIATGLVLLVLSAAVGLAGLELWNFNVAMVLLGVGWNFGFIGSTALVTDCHSPSERGLVQGVNDLCVFGFTALCSLGSGVLLSLIGWHGVNYAVFPLATIAMAVLLLSGRRADRAPA